MPNDFLSHYLQYTHDTEATATFHRWSAIVGIGAWLERNIWIQHGATQFFPNHYAMLLGESGSRKSAAIKGFVRILKAAGYTTIAAEKTSKEKFSQDLAARHHESEEGDDLLFSDLDSNAITPILIANDEANDFFGINNIEFLSMLGAWWDHSGSYEIKYKTSKSDVIPNVTPSILVGNTPTNFSLAFPPTIIGQGFFSRILLIHGERTRPKIAWPTPPSVEDTAAIVQMIQQMKQVMIGELVPTPHAKLLAKTIYELPDKVDDHRFTSYFNRRFTHLLKLSLVVAASKFERSITEDTIIQANTYLTYIQNLMPKALGEYGKSEDSELMHKTLSYIVNAERPVPHKELVKQFVNDVKTVDSFRHIISKLQHADKIQLTKIGWLPVLSEVREKIEERSAEFVDFNRYLTSEELGVKTS